MLPTPQRIQTIYLTLMLCNTLAASFIWGINTLFLLDAGLSNLEAFAANAFFTVGMVLFEVPTGMVADTWGRRRSYLLGTITLSITTILYLLAWQVHAPFWGWAVSSMLLGLGFTFFSGATEAWLVDALTATKFKGSLDSVFAKGQIVGGIAMLTGSVAGGFVAQATDLGVPYIIRAGILGGTFLIAFFFMKDLGFVPQKQTKLIPSMKNLFVRSFNTGLRRPELRWIMLAGPFGSGVGIYVFYAMQPYLLELYGDPSAYGVAGLAAAIVAGAQIVGGLVAVYLKKIFNRRTTVMLLSVVINSAILVAIGLTNNFWMAVALIVVWGLLFAATTPVRQAYLNGLIPSQDRATILSFDNMLASSGGVVIQPALGKAADVWNYSTSYLFSSLITFAALPFIVLARREKAESDIINK